MDGAARRGEPGKDSGSPCSDVVVVVVRGRGEEGAEEEDKRLFCSSSAWTAESCKKVFLILRRGGR